MANRQQGEKSRAEQVRARRQQNSKNKPKAPFGSNVTRKPKPQNVMVPRRTTKTVPVAVRKRNTTTIPIKKKGVELQIPALPRLQLGWRYISGAVFLLSLLIIISFSSLSTFQISTIHLKGAERLTPEIVLSKLDLAGTPIIKIEPETIQKRVEASFPDIKNPRVSISLPAKITIQLEEREPLILWEQEGSLKWIDAEGVVFPALGEADIVQKVLAAGNPPAAPRVVDLEMDIETGVISHQLEEVTPQTTPKFVEAILSLTPVVPEGSELLFDPQFGLGWRDPMGWLVYFGQDTTNIATKLSEYQTILAVLDQQDIIPALISLEFIHAPYYRLEQ